MLETVLEKLTSRQQVTQGQLLEAIKEAEKEKLTPSNLASLEGEWLLIWTSGTKNLQQLQPKKLENVVKPVGNRILQRVDSTNKWIENEVSFPGGLICVAGNFEYTEKKRLEFVFSQAQLKIGNLPKAKINWGKWAKGWLQTTYFDENIHIERGDQGGVSIYQKVR